MSEAKMSGKMRRAIVRADEGEVRRRVALALGGSASIRWYTGNDEVEIYARVDFPRSPTPGDLDALATVGIFPGRDGWEIEVRRALPAPWKWWPVNGLSEFLARSNNPMRAIADALPHEFTVFDSELSIEGPPAVPVTSLAEARERAEDECWARRLIGADEDAPPVKPDATPPGDRAQAIRDALIDRLGDGPGGEVDLLLHVLGTESWSEPKPALPEVRSALASIGAVRNGAWWRLSMGPPPGWEWRAPTIEDCEALVRVGRASETAIACIDDTRGIEWDIYPTGGMLPAGPTTFAPSREAARDAALLDCRRAGLFAPVAQADEEPAVPTDGGVDRTAPDLDARVSAVESQVATLVQSVAAHVLQRDTVDPAWGALEARAARAEQERAAAKAAERSAFDAVVTVTGERNMYRTAAGKLREQVGAVTQERDADRATIADLEAQIAGLVGRLATMTAERDEMTARHRHARQVRDTWQFRAERAESTVAAMREALAKAAP